MKVADVVHHDAAKISKLIKKPLFERIMKNTNFKQNNFETVKCDSPSHNSVYCFKHNSCSSGAAGYGKPAWCSMNKTNDSGTFGAACQVKAMQECSTVCGMCASQPSLYKARYTKKPDYHRVRSRRDLNPAFTTNRSLRDLAPMCLRHIGTPRLTSGREAHAPTIIWWKSRR